MHNLSKELNTDESVLKEISQHKLDNAFSQLDWGGGGQVFGGTPVDFMHDIDQIAKNLWATVDPNGFSFIFGAKSHKQ